MPDRTPMNRRRFFKYAVRTTFAGGLGALGYAWRVEPHWIQIVRRPLPIANLPVTLAGRTLVQISDIHAGGNVDEEYLIAAMRRVSDLQPDIIVITGDFVTYNGRTSITAAQRVLSHLQPARLASIGILGNHDYGHGFFQPAVADEISEKLATNGLQMLRNSMLDVEGMQIAGLDDYWGPRFAPQAVLSAIDPQQPSLVLCHNPDVADEPVWNGYAGWILCGHTHGGQCAAPLLGPPILPVKNKRYSSGEIALGDGRTMYINRGLGHLHRVRFNARPEITVFTLTHARA